MMVVSGICRLSKDMEKKTDKLFVGTVVSNFFDSRSKERKGAFLDIVAFGNIGENLSKYFRKGHQVFIFGELRQSEWENQEGKRRTKLYLQVGGFAFVDKDKGNEGKQEIPF